MSVVSCRGDGKACWGGEMTSAIMREEWDTSRLEREEVRWRPLSFTLLQEKEIQIREDLQIALGLTVELLGIIINECAEYLLFSPHRRSSALGVVSGLQRR